MMPLKMTNILKTLILIFFINACFCKCTSGHLNRIQNLKERFNNITIHFTYDDRLKARPYRVYLARSEEWFKSVDNLESKRILLYQIGKQKYKFYDIKPGIYWLGVSFPVLKKNGQTYIRDTMKPPFSTSSVKPKYRDKSTHGVDVINLIYVKRQKRINIDLDIQVRLVYRPDGDQNDPQGYFKFIKRAIPKTKEEERMLDENYFFSTHGWFEHREEKMMGKTCFLKIVLQFDMFNDYPFDTNENNTNQKEKEVDFSKYETEDK